MLFFVDESFVDYLSVSQDRDTEALSAVECLAQSRRTGYNLVFADIETLKFLKSYEPLSLTARKVYNYLYQRAPQEKSYLEHISIYVHIMPSGDEIGLIRENGKDFIKVSAKFICNISMVGKTILLGENQRDVQVYKKMAETYLYISRIGSVSIGSESRGGGGQTIQDEYLSIKQSCERLCLCIVDSDRKSPGLEWGATAKSIERVDQTISNPFCNYMVIDARDIENVIPMSIYSEICSSDVNRNLSFQTLQQVEQFLPEAMKYVDIKKGLKIHELITTSRDSPHRQFWEGILIGINKSIDCFNGNKCQGNNRQSFDCFVINGMGSSIISSVIDFLERKDISEIADMIDERLMTDWKDIGLLVLSWCCAGERIVAG